MADLAFVMNEEIVKVGLASSYQASKCLCEISPVRSIADVSRNTSIHSTHHQSLLEDHRRHCKPRTLDPLPLPDCTLFGRKDFASLRRPGDWDCGKQAKC
jgi:hypothetical protein